MSMFFAAYKAKPDKTAISNNRIADGVGSAQLWVRADSPEQAEALCLSYMGKYSLLPIEREGVWNSRDLPMQNLKTSVVQLYRRAEQYGIAMDFLAVSSDNPPLHGLRPWNS